jgi:hypothetical protein
MPVYKYRSFKESEEHLKKLLPSDPLVRAAKLEEILKQLKPTRPIQRGVFKFKTLEEANRHRKEMDE